MHRDSGLLVIQQSSAISTDPRLSLPRLSRTPAISEPPLSRALDTARIFRFLGSRLSRNEIRFP